MRIMLINVVYGVGSTGRIVRDLRSVISSKGYQSVAAYGRDTDEHGNDVIRIGGDIDNYIHLLYTRLFDAHGMASKTATKKLISEIDVLKPDIIHLHNIHGYYINIGILFAYLKKAKIPIVWTFHDCWSITGHCSHYDYVGCDQWIEGCKKCPIINEYPKSLLIDCSRRNYIMKKNAFCDIKDLIIVTPSKWLSEQVKLSYLKEYQIKVINNGIDLDVFKPTDSDFRFRFGLDSKFIILGVSSIWCESKGYRYFVDLNKRLKNDEVIVLVGLTEAQKRQLPAGIVGITKTNNLRELSEIYSAADVFVNPTLEDTFPTTNLEALACGTPVISFNTGGSPESVDNGSGVVVGRGDMESLVKAIGEIKNNGKGYYSENCHRRARKLYNKSQRYDEYVKLYESIVNSAVEVEK
jgi:putative colanic acid biosynthesis glycosyltransferase